MSVSMYERSSASSLGRGIPTHMPVTEDTPPDYLEGHMQLLCVLPSGKPVEIAVERRTPMLDVLVQICTSRRLAPGDHVLTLTDLAKQILPFKPSTPIGSLDAHTVHVSAKGRELLNGKVSSTSAKAGQPFESTIRLQVHLPRNQLHVLRVSPRTPLAQILHTVCVEKGLDPNLYEVRHPANVDERLRLSCCLADYKLQEITVVLCGNPATLSAADLPAMQSSKNPSRATSEIVGSEKKKKGLFGFVFGKKSRMHVSDFRSPPLSDESPTRIEVPCSHNGSKSSPPPSRETSANMLPPHPPTRMKKRPAPAPPPGVKSPLSPVAVNGSGSLPECKKSSSVISTSSSEKSGRNLSRQGSDSSSGYHESSVVSEHEPAQKNVGPSSLSDVAAPPRLRPKLANGVGQSPRAVSVINLSQSSALHPPSASNLTKMQSQSHTSLSSAGKKRKAPAPPPLSVLSTSTISASTTVTPSVSSDASVREAGTASHRSSMTDSTISATSSSVVSSVATVPIDSPPSRSSSSSNTAASTGEKPAARQSKSRLIESQPPPQQPPPRASSSSSTTKTNLVNALSPPMQPNVEKAVSIPVVPTPPVPSPRKKYAVVPLPPLPVEDDLDIDDWSLFEQETALFPSSSSSSTSTLPMLVAPPKPRRQWGLSDESSRPESRLTTQTMSSAADCYSISNSSGDDVTSVESLRTKQVRQLKKAFVKPDWSSPPSANPSAQAKVPGNAPKKAQFTVPQYVQLQQGPASKRYPNDVRFGISSTDNSDNEKRKRVRKRSSKEKKGQHMLRYSTRKYSTPSSPSSSSLEDDLTWRVSKTTSKGNPRLSASPKADKESSFKRSFSEGDFDKDDLASDSTSVAASDFGPVMDNSQRNLLKSKSRHSMQMGLNRWEKVEVSDLSAWFDEFSLGLKSETSSEKSAKDQKTHSLLYRDSSTESGEDAIYERVKPMAKIIAAEQKPQAGTREVLPMEAIYSVVVKKPKAVEVREKEEEAVPVPVKTLDRVQNGKIEALEAPKEPEQLPREEDIAWEYKLPDPPTPFQDTPLLTIPDPVVSGSETLSRSLSSASESDRATSPILEAKEVLDSVQDLRWQAGESRTEAEEVEEEVIVPVKVQKAPSLVVNGKKDENILVLTEQVNEESQTDDLVLETQVEHQETVRVMQDEAVQCQDELALAPKERLVEDQVEFHVTEEKAEEESKTKLAPSVEKTEKSQKCQAEVEKSKEVRRREEQEEETAAIEELELTLQDYEDSPASFPPITVEIHQIPSESSSTTSGSRKSSISSHTDVQVHIVPALQPKATSPILRQSNSAALFTISSMKTELELDLTDSLSLDSFDKETKRNSLSSLQKSESMALPIKPKLLKRQSSFGDGDQEPSTGKETPVNAPPVSSDAAQTSPPVNVELFMQAQQLFSKAAENMGNQQLQEEFIRLQQQFITWQQQLLANQQVIQTKLTHSMQTDAPAPSILQNETEKGPILEENSGRKVQLAENVERKVEIVPNTERTVEIIQLEPEKKVEINEEQPKHSQPAKFHPEIVGEPPTMKTNSEILVEEPRTVRVIEKPVDDVTSAPQIGTFPEDIPKEPVYRYQGPPTIKLEPWRPGRPRSEIIDFSRDSSFFLPDQLSQPSEPRKSVRELAQRSQLEQLIKPLTFPKPSDAKKIAVLPQHPSPEPQVEVFSKEEVEKRDTKPLLTKQVTLPATVLVSTKTNDVPSPLPANFTDFAVPNIVSTQSSAPYRPTLVRRASIGTPRPFELKQAPLRKIQFPIRAPEVRGFAPLKPDVLLSQSQAPVNPKPTNQMRDKLIESARRPSAELKPLEMEELAKLGTKTMISPSEPTIPPPPPLSLPTLRPAHLRKPLLPAKSMLDPREELMIAIRSFGASGGLRKNENPLWSGQ